MKDLKTLKDLDTWTIQSLEKEEGGRPIDEEELKAEAVKWVKDCEERRKLGLPNLSQEEFLKHFFNLTEADLEEKE